MSGGEADALRLKRPEGGTASPTLLLAAPAPDPSLARRSCARPRPPLRPTAQSRSVPFCRSETHSMVRRAERHDPHSTGTPQPPSPQHASIVVARPILERIKSIAYHSLSQEPGDCETLPSAPRLRNCTIRSHRTPTAYLTQHPREAAVPCWVLLDPGKPAGCGPLLSRGQCAPPLPACAVAWPASGGHPSPPGWLPWRSQPQMPLQGSKPRRPCRPGELPAQAIRSPHRSSQAQALARNKEFHCPASPQHSKPESGFPPPAAQAPSAPVCACELACAPWGPAGWPSRSPADDKQPYRRT